MVGSMLIGRFRIGNRLGAGAFGETFLAQDTQKMNAQCVVKRLITPSDPAHIGIVRQMFDKEAKKLNALDHQGIPKLIAYFEDGGEFYLVQDFVDGNTLDKEINPNRKWREAEVKDFLLEVLEILAYVHSQGSIHRDLKPNNMMRRNGNKKLVLIDFGAVREVRQTTNNLAIGLASGTITIGTPGYMPAEQTQGRPCYASDVYAIGCMAIEALIGISPCPPYGFDTDVNTGEFRWRHGAKVSDELAAIIDRMVCYDWRQRYANGGAALVALQSLSSNRLGNVSNPPHVKTAPKNPVTNPANKTPYVPRPNPSATSTRRKFIIGLAVATPLAIVAWDWWKPKPQTAQKTIPNSQSPVTETPRSSQNDPISPSPTPTFSSQLQKETLNNIITVDSSGKEINRRSVQVQYFVEDKISLPSGARQIAMALIPAGNFEMGMPTFEKQIVLENAIKNGVRREKVEKWLDASTPTRNISFAQSFYVSRYAVTQAQWFAVMGTNYDKDGFKKRFGELNNKFKGDNRPMVVVYWKDAKAYCVKLSEKTGRNYRLPTESEWEYSCRAKTTTPFYFGETITSELVNHNSNHPYAKVDKNSTGYRQVTTDVGTFPPNEWGLYDMHGNVWEWCEDVWHENYNGVPTDGSAWLSGNNWEQGTRLHRGGSCGGYALSCLSTFRNGLVTLFSNSDIGFRVAASVL